MAATIRVDELQRLAGPAHGQWIDVRSASEYATGHIPGSINIPMEQVETRLQDLEPGIPIILICQAGARARQVAHLLEPCGMDVKVLEGGTSAWMRAGLPIVANVASRWSLERQVRLGAGVLVLASAALALTIDVRWIYLAGLAGAGLTMAGVTNFCPMGLLLAKLPWNQAPHCKVPEQSSGQACCR